MNGYRTYITIATMVLVALGTGLGIITQDEGAGITDEVAKASTWNELFPVVMSLIGAVGLYFARRGAKNDAEKAKFGHNIRR